MAETSAPSSQILNFKQQNQLMDEIKKWIAQGIDNQGIAKHYYGTVMQVYDDAYADISVNFGDSSSLLTKISNKSGVSLQINDVVLLTSPFGDITDIYIDKNSNTDSVISSATTIPASLIVGTITAATINANQIIAGGTLSGVTINVSSNAWHMGANDFGLTFGSPVAGTLGSASIKYYQGADASSTYLAYVTPTSGWHNFLGGMTVNGDLQVSGGIYAATKGYGVRYDWVGSIPLNSSVNITHNFGYQPITNFNNWNQSNNLIIGLTHIDVNTIKVVTTSTTGQTFNGDIMMY